MVTFLIVLAYLLCFVPLARSGIRAALKREVSAREWKFGVIFMIAGLTLISLALYFVEIFTEALWFSSLGYSSVFWKIFFTRMGLFFGVGLLVFGFLMSNARIAKKLVPAMSKDQKRRSSRRKYWDEEDHDRDWHTYTYLVEKWGVPIISGLIALVVGLIASAKWNTVLLYLNGTSFDIADPIFEKDVGFYMFNLPFLNFLSSTIFWVLFVTIIAVGLLYYFYYAKIKEFVEEKTSVLYGRAVRHLALLGAALLGVLIWMRWLGFYKYLYSGGLVYGAGYTDIVKITMNKIFIAVLAVVILYLLIRACWSGIGRIFWERKRYLGYIMLALVPVIWLSCMVIAPAWVQAFSVKPNELQKEAQYISYNIDFTQQAFGLKDLDEQLVELEPTLTPETLKQNQATLENVRLWDWRALYDTYKERQLFRLYYEFPDIDIDRYQIDGQYRQVMLAAREIDQTKLVDPTWVNKYLKYTHGYGVALNAVNEFGPQGMPNLLVKDIPPISSVESLRITQPEIYYGELTTDRVFVKTGEEEFDYPRGDANAYCTYQGEGGVKLGSFLKRAAFAIKFNDIKILLSSALNSDSRVMYHRQIEDRVKTIAPFLAYDRDPYLVIDNQGKLWWIQDAYTASTNYPYSRPHQAIPYMYSEMGETKVGYRYTLNYIRNSVKVLIDPYNGDVQFYVFDESDPLIQAYQNIFPGLFKSKEEMPADLLAHVRYPEDLLSLQAEVYRTYHMKDPQVFYNKEDIWNIATEVYIGGEQEVIPYYVIIRLPGEEKEEFIQMLPFTPKNKRNMVAWMAGRCDGENYGKLLLYKFSKQELIYGPRQIEARIDQNTEMSEKFTLWGQSGSQVIRGNLLVIPVDNSILYVEPVYIRAEGAKMPEIKKIVVGYGDKIEWGDTFEEALSKILREAVVPPEKPPTVPSEGVSEEVIAQMEKMNKMYQEFQQQWQKEWEELMKMLKGKK